jgi:hypothetical protein
MLWANRHGRKIQAFPGVTATCPACGGEVVPKCGEIVEWHWAHKARDCDSWGEPESQWHLGWKARFPAEWQEVVMGPHRADVRTPRGVIEFQKSAISAAEIREREQFYGKMIWVVDASGFNLEPHLDWSVKRFRQKHGISVTPSIAPDQVDWRIWSEEWREKQRKFCEDEHHRSPCYRWLWPRKTWLEAEKTMILDRGNGELLRVKKVYGKSSVYLACAPLTVGQLLRACGAEVE